MANNLLSELLDNVRRLYYTIDDGYAQPNILTGEPLLAELNEDLEPLQTLFPKVKTPLLLVQKYYSKYVNVTDILEQADRDVADYQAGIAEAQKKNAAAKVQIKDIAASQKALAKDAEKLQAALADYDLKNKDLVNEQGLLSPLMEKTKYQKIYKELQQQATQYNIDILEAQESLKNIGQQMANLEQEAAKIQAAELLTAELLSDLANKVIEAEQQKANANEEPDFQEESQAFAELEQFFEAVKNKDIQAYIRKGEQTLPKNWRNILEGLCKSRLPQMSGELVKKNAKDLYPQLSQQNLEQIQFKVAAALSGLRHSLNQKIGVQFEDCAYLPVHTEVLAKVVFREKGRIIAARTQHQSSNDTDFDDEAEESNTAANSIEIFANYHKTHYILLKNCSPNLYILFKQYVIEIEFLPQF